MVLPFASPASSSIDPAVLLAALSTQEPYAPKIPPGYKKHPKPDPERAWLDGKVEERRWSGRDTRFMDTIRRLRGQSQGVFESDIDDREMGDQDEYHSSQLIDDWNLLCAILASLEFAVVKRVLQRAQREQAQTLEDWVRFLREEELYRWSDRGDIPLEMAEAKVLTTYGVLISRHLPNLDDPDYPFRDTLVDPMSAYPVFAGDKGLVRMHRFYRTTYARVCGDFGDPRPKDAKLVMDRLGSDRDNRIVTVHEYADTCYRGVSILGGVELLPMTEHKLYKVPYVVQFGPAGEPMFTDTGKADMVGAIHSGNGWWRTGPDDDWGLEHKAVSSIHLQRERHDQFEAFMARVLAAANQAANPAYMLTRENYAGTKPLPTIKKRPGDVNEFFPGEQLAPLPTSMNPSDMNVILQALQQDKLTGSIPLGMFGQAPGSNNSGNSMSNAAENGMDHITPWVRALETYHTRKMELKTYEWRNMGHKTRFVKGEEKPFMVPVTRPMSDQELGRIVTPGLIDAIGCRVSVTLTRLRVQELMTLANAGMNLIQAGVMTRRRLAERIGEFDYDRLRDEWQEEQNWEQIHADQAFTQGLLIPIQIFRWSQEATTDEERAFWMAMLDRWMAMYAQPQVPGMPGAPLPMGGPAGPMAPPQAAGISYPATGQGPGSVTGVQGGPPGPVGPRPGLPFA